MGPELPVATSPSSSAAVDVSVIIPVLDQPQELARCLAALAGQTLARERFEVLVADNGSREAPPCAGATCIEVSTPGSYAARNAALAQARGRVLAFTDADCLPAPDWLERGLARVGAVRRCGLVAGRIEVFTRAVRATPVELYELATAFPQRTYVRAGYGATANVFVPREIFDAVGAFRADLESGGDLEWGQRVAATGRTIEYAGDVVVRHPARATWEALAAKKLRVIRGEWQRSCADPAGRRRWRLKRLRDLVPPVGEILACLRLPRITRRGRWAAARVALRAHYLQLAARWRTPLPDALIAGRSPPGAE